MAELTFDLTQLGLEAGSYKIELALSDEDATVPSGKLNSPKSDPQYYSISNLLLAPQVSKVVNTNKVEILAKDLEGKATGFLVMDTVNGVAKYIGTLTRYLEEMPNVKDVITMDLGNGTQRYRVIDVDGTIATVAALYLRPKVSFNQRGSSVYAGGELDEDLNVTFWNTLSSTAQSAIQDTELIQYKYDTAIDGTIDYTKKTIVRSIGTRKIFTLDYSDIMKYFGGTDIAPGSYTDEELYQMFWETDTPPANEQFCLRSLATGNYESDVMVVHVKGISEYIPIWFALPTISVNSRPAFRIDLSQISWERTLKEES